MSPIIYYLFEKKKLVGNTTTLCGGRALVQEATRARVEPW